MSAHVDQLRGLPMFAVRGYPKAGSQCDRVLAYLEGAGSISDMEALDALRIRRLAARIYDLRKLGWSIESTDEAHAGGTHARYRLTA